MPVAEDLFVFYWLIKTSPISKHYWEESPPLFSTTKTPLFLWEKIPFEELIFQIGGWFNHQLRTKTLLKSQFDQLCCFVFIKVKTLNNALAKTDWEEAGIG